MEKISLKYVAGVMLLLKSSLIGFLVWKIVTSPNELQSLHFDKEFLLC